MKRFIRESLALMIQMFFFYIFPLFAGPTDVIAMVLIMLMATFVLSVVLGGLSGNRVKYLYPAAIALLFIPSVWIYYNESALIHAVWYFVIAETGILLGSGVRGIISKMK